MYKITQGSVTEAMFATVVVLVSLLDLSGANSAARRQTVTITGLRDHDLRRAPFIGSRRPRTPFTIVGVSAAWARLVRRRLVNQPRRKIAAGTHAATSTR